jgi:chlorobactene glucosyltransferase
MTVTPEGYLAIAYALAGPGAWALFAFVAVKGRARLKIRPEPMPTLDAPPAATLIVPCRNEAAGIADCLRSALAQDYAPLQVIAVDDRSDDGTAEAIDALAAIEPRLKTLHVRDGELPPGWLGKPNAVCRGVEASSGEWLVFIDSDCTLDPTAVRQAITTGVKREFDLVSFVPRFEPASFWDAVVTPLCSMATGGMYSMIWANARNRPQTAFACGQFIAVRRAAYEQVGGHAAIADSAGEDVELARRMKRAGLSPRIGWGMELVSTRMYSTLGDLFNGWGRNFIAASRGRTARVWGAIAFLLLCTLSVWPAAVAGIVHDVAFNGRIWLALACVHYLLITAVLADGYRWGRVRPLYALLWPLGTLVLLLIFAKSLYLSTRRQVVWRGTRYDLKPLSTGNPS